MCAIRHGTSLANLRAAAWLFAVVFFHSRHSLSLACLDFEWFALLHRSTSSIPAKFPHTRRPRPTMVRLWKDWGFRFEFLFVIAFRAPWGRLTIIPRINTDAGSRRWAMLSVVPSSTHFVLRALGCAKRPRSSSPPYCYRKSTDKLGTNSPLSMLSALSTNGIEADPRPQELYPLGLRSTPRATEAAAAARDALLRPTRKSTSRSPGYDLTSDRERKQYATWST
ncbi:hypothetical protein CC78DRAFT_614565 [Lojkania enalia]|uniref:Uncharacterized protein n=1 Tax=Lojkania enalia TaxID=147567 RepID=A0A9P4KEC2_9PLEO|nr:hypothetical protein CC78DRAFT_614565 [Didymosphaeria enalia]